MVPLPLKDVQPLDKRVSLVHPGEVGRTLSNSDAAARNPRVPQQTGHHGVAHLDERQDDEQIASHGTLMLEKDGRSQYLGPTAGSEWLKDVGQFNKLRYQLRLGSLKCETRQLHPRKQPAQVPSLLSLEFPFRVAMLRPQTPLPLSPLVSRRKASVPLNYLGSYLRETRHGSWQKPTIATVPGSEFVIMLNIARTDLVESRCCARDCFCKDLRQSICRLAW